MQIFTVCRQSLSNETTVNEDSTTEECNSEGSEAAVHELRDSRSDENVEIETANTVMSIESQMETAVRNWTAIFPNVPQSSVQELLRQIKHFLPGIGLSIGNVMPITDENI